MDNPETDPQESGVSVIARFHYRHQAELAFGFLENAGIPASLFMDDGGGAQVGLTFVAPGRLVVGSENRLEALEVLEAAGYGDRLER